MSPIKGMLKIANEVIKEERKYVISSIKQNPLILELRRMRFPDNLGLFRLISGAPQLVYDIGWRSKYFAKQIKIEHFSNFQSDQSKGDISNEQVECEKQSDVPLNDSSNYFGVEDNLLSEMKHPIDLKEITKQRKVPSSRLGRMASFGSLAVGLCSDYVKNRFNNEDTTIMSKNSATRLVDTLCKVRGAALKLGQMLSIQDSGVVNPEFLQILERVRRQADFMPERQLHAVLSQELGSNWRDKFSEFSETPFASASIGQVHKAAMLDGTLVAVKVQYPGVARSIDSDIDNLMSIIKYSNIFPSGLYLDQMLKSMRIELKEEVDYIREAQNQRRFGSLIKDDPCFYVPSVIDKLSTERILTAEFIDGFSLEQAIKLPDANRNKIAENILRLCLQEVFKWNFMQTDPNWANFLVSNNGVINLLDFGACRNFNKASFVDKYIELIKAASVIDTDIVYKLSVDLGFLTGLEDHKMKNTHIEAVMLLGEAFRFDRPFDFGVQDTTRRIMRMIPTMVEKRLTPPPEETYSLHRKMSGTFLACAKLKAKINCKRLFDQVYSEYVPSTKS